MEDIDQTISTLQELIRCNDLEEVRRLKRKFEDLVGATEKTNLNYESMPLIDQLNEQTKALVQKVEKLSGRGMFPEGIALDVFEEKRGDILPTSKLAGETTAIRNMEKIYDFINGDVRKVGVYGMGGIGKTSVMKHINNRILEEKNDKFDCVIWVTVSKETSIFKLQDDIGRNLNVDLSNYGDTTTRAGALFKAFKEKRKYLLILDDLWEEFSLEDVGIPDPNDANGCKLVLTTRLRKVCQSMKCEAIKMDLLSEEEAWSLFLDHLGCDVLQVKDLEPIVRDVASECARLPLAIATIAKSMRGEMEAYEWRDALAKLRAFSKEPGDKGKKVIEQLKFSYDRLENKKLQKCLLLCALYPEDKEIERRELVELLALEGIIEKKEYKREEIDEGNVMLNNLINQCLLDGEITSNEYSWVKMHDLVRDMAQQIDGLHSQYLTISGTKMWELGQEKFSNEILKIHISNFYSLNVSPMCPKLTTFILEEKSLTNIPDSFFQHFKALKILNLSGCSGLQVLPNSISNLVNLIGLLLRYCYTLSYVPSLARLKDLQTFDFYGEVDEGELYNFEEWISLPEGLEKLSNLTYLNLILCPIEVFPFGIIQRLSNLRYLVCNPCTIVSVRELMGLKNLEMFKGRFRNICDLCDYVKHREQKGSRLSSYTFLVGLTPKDVHTREFFSETLDDTEFDKVCILKNCNLDKLAAENDVNLFPKDVQMLDIESIPDLTSICASNSATDLRICAISDCNGMRELVSTSSSSSFVLPSLESLLLNSLENLESLIGRKKKVCNVFPCLRELRINGCPRMKVVINIGVLPNLNNLEELDVRDCKELEEILGEWLDDEKDVNEGMTPITLPKLKHLTLWMLPHLRSICPASRPLICKSLADIVIVGCAQLEQCVYVSWDEGGDPSPSASLQPVELKSPMSNWRN